MFKHDICCDQPEVPDSMPDSFDQLPLEFFMNPRCPPAPIAIEATATEVDQSEVVGRVEELERSPPIEDFDGTS